ncbi:MAG: hypothetical protein RL717_1514 [Pseudomonadota bacterium]|jgi:hypothetical protein
MKPYKLVSLVAALLLMTGLAAHADHHGEQKTRVGTCEDAKKQMDYFCDQKNAATDSMVALGTACRNAKINLKEACEGLVEPDPEYKSCKMEQKC